MLDAEYLEDMRKIMALTNNADDYIENGEYLIDTEESTINQTGVLLQLYSILLEELSNMGIFLFDEREATSDFYTARIIYFMRKAVSIDKVYQKCMSSKEDYDYLNSLIEGENSDLIADYLDWMYKSSSDYEYIKEESFMRFGYNEHFIEHLSAIFNMCNEDYIDYDEDQYIEMSDKLFDAKKFLLSLLEKIEPHLHHGNIEALRRRCENHDNEKLETSTLNIYAHKGDPEYVSLYREVYKKHLENVDHHLEYWKKRKEKISFNALYEWLMNEYREHVEERHTFVAYVNAQIDMYPDVFDVDTIREAIDVANVIMN